MVRQEEGESQLDMWMGSGVTEGSQEVTDQEVSSGHNPEAVRSTFRIHRGTLFKNGTFQKVFLWPLSKTSSEAWFDESTIKLI